MCMQLFESLLNRSPLLGQLLTTIDMAPTAQQKTGPASATANAIANTAPRTPPPSQKAPGLLLENDTRSADPTAHPMPATPVSPPEAARPNKRRRVVSRIIRPEPGSLYDIMHDHAGESLYITPICWTDAHAQLLNVQFVDCDSIRRPVPDLTSMSKYPPRPSRIANNLSRGLTELLKPYDMALSAMPMSVMCMASIMRIFFPSTLCKAKRNADLELHFGDRVLKRAVRVAVLWRSPDRLDCSFDSASTRPASSCGRTAGSSAEQDESQESQGSAYSSKHIPGRPLLAFVNRTHLSRTRRGLYRLVPGPVNGDRLNTPVFNLQQLRSKKLVPKNTFHDSYIVAIMLAMAQSHFYPPRSRWYKSSPQFPGSFNGSGSFQPSIEFFDVPVKLISQDIDTAEFVVYSAVVTKAFLSRFSDPTKAPDASDLLQGGLKVDVTRVPIWPVLGLKERLAKALGSEISGEECSQALDGEIETWESEMERQARLGSRKRSREVLTEMFNRSFDSADRGSPGREGSSVDGMEPSASSPVASPSMSPRASKRRRTQSMNELEVC